MYYCISKVKLIVCYSSLILFLFSLVHHLMTFKVNILFQSMKWCLDIRIYVFGFLFSLFFWLVVILLLAIIYFAHLCLTVLVARAHNLVLLLLKFLILHWFLIFLNCCLCDFIVIQKSLFKHIFSFSSIWCCC